MNLNRWMLALCQLIGTFNTVFNVYALVGMLFLWRSGQLKTGCSSVSILRAQTHTQSIQ